MTKVIVGELRILPSLANINRHPFAIGEEFRPAMVALHRTLVFLCGNGRADGKPTGNANAARQGDEVSMKIGAVAGLHVAGIDSVAAAPA